MAKEAPNWIPEMRGKHALEGPELGAIMADVMRARERNNTTTAQRTALLREMALQQPGPSGRAREEVEKLERIDRDDYIHNIRSMERIAAKDADIRGAQKSMADASGRGLQEPYDWGTSQTGAAQSEEDALMAQMAADAEQQRQANVSVDTAGTPGGFTTGENQYVQNLAQQEQFPQAFAGQGSSQFGGTELGMVPKGRRTEQGFSAENYIPGEKQVQEQDLVGKKIMEFLSGAGLKEGATEGAQEAQAAGTAGAEVGKALGAEVPMGDATGQQQSGVVATGLGDSGGMKPGESELLAKHKSMLIKGREDINQNADQSVAQKTLGDDSGFPPIGGKSGQVQEVSGEEQNAAIVQSLLSELEAAGVEANDLRMLNIDVDKFLSGVYNMADVDKLRIAARIAGVPANLRGRIETMSSNVSGTSGRGFDSPTYDEGVRQREGETFMEYTQRMHQRNKDMSGDPNSTWVDPANRV